MYPQNNTPKKKMGTLVGLLASTAVVFSLGATNSYAADLDPVPVVDECENKHNHLFCGRLQIGLLAAQHFNALQADSGAFFQIDEETDASFQRLRFNLELTFHITDNVFGFVDIAEEPNDFQGLDPFSLNQDFGHIDLNLTGLAGITEGPEVHLKTGNIGVGTFDGNHAFSDGGSVQGNELIGNAPTSFGTAQSGAQIIISDNLDGFIKSYSFDAAITVPTFGGDSNPGKDFNGLFGLGINTNNGIGLSTRFFIGQGGDQLGNANEGGSSNAIAAGGVVNDDGDLNNTNETLYTLDGVQGDGLFAGDGDNYFLASNNRFGANGDNGDGRSSRIFHQNLLPGFDGWILQFNASYRADFGPGTLLRAWGGFAQSDFSFVDAAGQQTVGENGTAIGVVEQESSISFFGVGIQQFLVKDKFYVAGRYTQVINTSDDTNFAVAGNQDAGSEDSLERFQIGAGYFIDERTLFKVEYVNQDEDANSAGQTGGFDGIVSELSVRF
ncbi:MAG: hypothetical protein ABJ081_01160 [Hyphomicrobiales bacterium]